MGLLRWRRGEVVCLVSVAVKWELGEEERVGQTRVKGGFFFVI